MKSLKFSLTNFFSGWFDFFPNIKIDSVEEGQKRDADAIKSDFQTVLGDWDDTSRNSRI